MTAPCLNSRRIVTRTALLTGIAASLTLLGGCAGSGAIKSASAQPAKAAAATDRALAKAEKAVQRAPQDAAARAALARAYLAAGRFQSAATTFDDAMALGDNSGRAALGLALAKIGLGRQREAVALLDDWRSEISAGDLGLALALAGDTARGVAILSDAVRAGESTPKLRQNLAYAFALDGRWSDARMMASQDLPAAELDQRMAVWTLSALPDRAQERIAGLLGAPLRSDPGQPAMLALRTDPAGEQLAAQDVPPVTAAPPVQEPVRAEPQARAGTALPATELPALAEAEPAAAPVPVVTQNLAVQIDRHVAAPNSTRMSLPVAQAVAQPATVVAARPVPRPSVASAFAGVNAKPVRVASAAPTVAPALAAAVGTGSHLVQLGAFSSRQGARRAWGIFMHRTPGLASFRMTITPATVRGKAVWRVAAAGLNGSGAATGLCSQVKSGGGACFAYAAPARPSVQPLTPGRNPAGPQRARR